jgi:hypothetical protein
VGDFLFWMGWENSPLFLKNSLKRDALLPFSTIFLRKKEERQE